jgi:hypothetical protein
MTKAYRPTNKIHPGPIGVPGWREPGEGADETGPEIMGRFLAIQNAFKGARRYITTAIAGKLDKA